MIWDGIAFHEDLGKGSHFLIYCLLARTVREYAHSTLGQLPPLVTMPIYLVR